MTPASGAVAVLSLALTVLVVWGGCELAAWLLLRWRVRNSLPEIVRAVTIERDRLIAAIEEFHARFGIYPPDHILSVQPLRIDPITNQLFYELTGAVYDRTNRTFFVDGAEPLHESTLREYFNTNTLVNATNLAGGVKHFLPRELMALKEIHDGPDVMVLRPNSVNLIEGIDFKVLWEWDVDSWHYVSSAPTNNPGKFDLWVELKAFGQTVTIRNW